LKGAFVIQDNDVAHGSPGYLGEGYINATVNSATHIVDGNVGVYALLSKKLLRLWRRPQVRAPTLHCSVTIRILTTTGFNR